jgi:putative redox protein
MVKIEIQYESDLRCRAIHEPSQTMLTTDAPLDNQGRGESFSPTDLVATALGTCILTTMAIMASTLGVELGTATASVTKEMTPAPRRIGRLATSIHISQTFDEETRLKLERAAHTCPVHRSLHPDVEAPITIHWAEVEPAA